MNSILDDNNFVKRIDSQNMLKALNDFSKSALKAIDNTEKTKIMIHGDDFDSILVSGMGGSAVGGLLLKDWLSDTLKIPIIVNRGYNLPAWVDEETIVYTVSYSGNTEETLCQYKEAMERGCMVICFCSGGTLEEKAKENDQPLFKFPKGYLPRASIPFQFYNLAGVTHKIGLFNGTKWNEVSESIKIIEAHCGEMNPKIPTKANPGKKFAEELKGYIPFVYAPRLFKSVAYRYSTQFNENSKSPSATNFYPEAFHNSIVASEGKKQLLNKLCAVIIRDPKEETHLNEKISLSIELLKETFGKIVTVNVRGESNLARLMSALIQGDYMSVYLGILYEADPSTTESIDILKDKERK